MEESSTKNIQAKLEDMYPVFGSGFAMENGTFVFFFVGFRGHSSLFIIAHSNDPETYLTFHFDNVTTPNCFSKCFLWEEKLFMFPLFCHGGAGNYKLQESDDMGQTWRESSGRLAEDLNGKSLTDTYIPITIGEKRALLYTRAEAHEENEFIYDINLFVAYNDRTQQLGKIFTIVEPFLLGSLLYTKDELFYLGAPGGHTKNITLFRLEEQLEEIKKLLDDPDANKNQITVEGTPPDSASN